jgi:hypothetical protein
MRERRNRDEIETRGKNTERTQNQGTFPARVDSGAAKTRKELGKTGKKQETENLRKPEI